MPIKISAASVSKYSLLAINALSCATAIFLTFQARLSPDEALIPFALPEREITRLGYPQTNLSIGEFDFSKSFRDYVRVIEQGDGDGTVRIVRRPITKQGISANKGLPPPRPRPNGAPPVVAQPPVVSQPPVVDNAIAKLDAAKDETEIAAAISGWLLIHGPTMSPDENTQVTVSIVRSFMRLNHNATSDIEQRADRAILQVQDNAARAIAAANSATDMAKWIAIIVSAISTLGILFGAWNSRMAGVEARGRTAAS